MNHKQQIRNMAVIAHGAPAVCSLACELCRAFLVRYLPRVLTLFRLAAPQSTTANRR
jgi:hypothetical protein